MEILGLLGHPLGHSLSPAIHNTIYKHYNLDAGYTLFDVTEEKLPDAINAIKVMNIKGTNVTIPYKEKVIKYLDYINENAVVIGAVNTIFNNNGFLEGYNTDYAGFKNSLEYNGIDIGNKDVFVIGTGGASKAIIQCLGNCNSRVHIIGRDLNKALGLKDFFEDKHKEMYCFGLDEINFKIRSIRPYMIVNCTPVGMKGFGGTLGFNKNDIKNNVRVLYDIVYNPMITEFLHMGKESGCKLVSGMDMLISQALESIYIWTGKKIDFIDGKKLLAKEGIVGNL